MEKTRRAETAKGEGRGGGFVKVCDGLPQTRGLEPSSPLNYATYAKCKLSCRVIRGDTRVRPRRLVRLRVSEEVSVCLCWCVYMRSCDTSQPAATWQSPSPSTVEIFRWFTAMPSHFTTIRSF